jgi:hypothetical protein
MKSAGKNRPTHIVKGNIFDALGFSASEASALIIKAEILSAILEHVRAKGYTRSALLFEICAPSPTSVPVYPGSLSTKPLSGNSLQNLPGWANVTSHA